MEALIHPHLSPIKSMRMLPKFSIIPCLYHSGHNISINTFPPNHRVIYYRAIYQSDLISWYTTNEIPVSSKQSESCVEHYHSDLHAFALKGPLLCNVSMHQPEGLSPPPFSSFQLIRGGKRCFAFSNLVVIFGLGDIINVRPFLVFNFDLFQEPRVTS